MSNKKDSIIGINTGNNKRIQPPHSKKKSVNLTRYAFPIAINEYIAIAKANSTFKIAKMFVAEK